MGSSREPYRSEWVSDYRRSRRWLASRTVLARLDGEEVLGKTEDVSLGGMKLTFADLHPLVGRRLELAVVFADRILDLEGTVLHLSKNGPWNAVGVEFDQPLDERSAAFLVEQYPPAMDAAGVELRAGA